MGEAAPPESLKAKPPMINVRIQKKLGSSAASFAFQGF
jgi:hypothetical protein